MAMKRCFNVLTFILPILVLACGGGGGGSSAPPPPPPPKWTYTDPAGSSYRLLRNASLSTDSYLVLNVVGPTGVQGRGVSFSLTVDNAKATWVKPESSDADLVAPATFDLGSAPQILKVKLVGNELQVAFGQKGSGVSAKPLDGTLARVALEIKPGANGSVSLTASKAQVLPASGAPQDITLALGTVAIQ